VLVVFEITFQIYMASPTRWAHLKRILPFPAVPRVGECVKFHNSELGDYFGWIVRAVTYRERGDIELMMSVLEFGIDDADETSEVENELDEYVGSYQIEGWSLSKRGVVPRAAGNSTEALRRRFPGTS
jgi:hypothetical protein